MGPLAGVTVIELAGLGPGPFCAMLLADMGAEVISVGRPGKAARPHDLLNRNKKSLIVDLKQPRGRELVLSLIERAQISPRRLPPRRDRAPGPGPGGLPWRESATGLWPHDRLGPERPLGRGGGP